MAKKINFREFGIGKTVIVKTADYTYQEGIIVAIGIKKLYTKENPNGTPTAYELHVSDQQGKVAIYKGDTPAQVVSEMYLKSESK